MEKDFTMPKTVTLENVSEEPISFRYFRVNFVEVLQPEDVVKLTAASSEEAAYYAALADEAKGLAVTVEAGE